MEFIENHFYKLAKKIPRKQQCVFPTWDTDISPYEACSRFTFNKIYQAVSKTSLYDDMDCIYSLDKKEIECFEEIEIGLNDASKKFMEKQFKSNKMTFQFTFLFKDMVCLKMRLYGKYGSCVFVMGVIGQINELLYNAYKELRKTYIKKIEKALLCGNLIKDTIAYDFEKARRNRAFIDRI